MAHNKYAVKFVSNYDGDTVKLIVKIWPNQIIKTKLRLKGIDTPEIRTRSVCEKAMAYAAKAHLESFLAGKTLYATDVFLGKYSGRVIGDLYADDVNVSDYLLKTGYAIPYAGGKRDHVWCVD